MRRGLPGCRVRDVRRQRLAVDPGPAVGPADRVPEDAPAFEIPDVRLLERRRDGAGLEQRGEDLGVEVAVDGVAVGQPPYVGVVVDGPREHAALVEVEERLGEHLGRAVETLLERVETAVGRDQFRGVVGGAERLDDLAVRLRAGVPELQRPADGVAERPDADLERAAVPDERADPEADGVVDHRDRSARRPEQRQVVGVVVEHRVERRGGHRRLAVHERHLVGDLADDHAVALPPLASPASGLSGRARGRGSTRGCSSGCRRARPPRRAGGAGSAPRRRTSGARGCS